MNKNVKQKIIMIGFVISLVLLAIVIFKFPNNSSDVLGKEKIKVENQKDSNKALEEKIKNNIKKSQENTKKQMEEAKKEGEISM